MSVHASSGPTSVAAPPGVNDRRPETPRVSVMLTTLPAGRLRHRDAARLEALLRRMELTLARQSPDIDVSSFSRRLRKLADSAARRPARRGLALFAGSDADHAITLPQPVFDRVVVDSHFDRRDVMVADQFSPPFRVLVVRHGLAQLYDSRPDDSLVERREDFPIAKGESSKADFHQRLAAELLGADADDPRPCVLAADDAVLRAEFDGLVPSSAGVLGASASWVRTDVLHRLARRHVADRRAALARAAVPAAGTAGWTRGLNETKAAIDERPHGLLVIEENLNDIPARGIQIVDTDQRSVHRSGLNAAISRVDAAGGTVLFVADRDLEGWAGVTFRPHLSQPDVA